MLYGLRNARTRFGALVVGALASSAASLAQPPGEWRRMQEEVISAKDLLGAELSNGERVIGKVGDLALSEESTRVERVLFEVPYAYRVEQGRNHGFVEFEDLVVETSPDELRARIADGATPKPPEALELVAQEADNRLASNILDAWLQFSNDELREIDNLLIDRDSGRITHYVIDMEAESVFDQNRRLIPAENVYVSTQGYVTASITLREADLIAQDYSQDLL